MIKRAGNSVSERLWPATGTSGSAANPYLQQHSSFSALPEAGMSRQLDNNISPDPHIIDEASLADRGRFTVQQPSPGDNQSITDADKLQQRGSHDNVTSCYHGDGSHRDRIPSRLMFESVHSCYSSVGHSGGQRSVDSVTTYQPYFQGDLSSSSAAAAASYSRRIPSQLESQVSDRFSLRRQNATSYITLHYIENYLPYPK